MTFVGAIATIIAIFIFCEVAPFGKHSLLTIDFFHQYGPMMGELFDRVKNFDQFIYSFNMGMGLPFFKNYYNYMSSLFNIILFLGKRTDLLTSYSFIIGLKVVLSAVTMGILLNKKMDKKKSMIPALSILYAFSNYFTAYYWNIMWLDGIVFLPLVVLGIEKLVDEKKILLYVISLALMLFSNYFIGYMICIFSVLYFLVYLLLIKEKNIKDILINRLFLFAISSLLAGGLVAFALIPIFSSLGSISATSDAWPTSQYYSFTIYEFIYNHFSGVSPTVLKSDAINAPNVSCSIIVVPLLFLFLFNRKINYKVKIGYILLIAFLITSYFYAPLDFIWHGFHVPNDLPYRYSFLYPFVMIIIAAYAIKDIDDVNDIIVIIMFVLSLLFTGSLFVVDFIILNDKIILMNFIVLILWFLYYVLYTFFGKVKRIIPIFAIFMVVSECVMGISNNWDISQDLKGFYTDYDYTEEALNYIRNNDEEEFYRIERNSVHTYNDPSWYNYNGITAFSSMEYENLAMLHYNLGACGNQINSFYYCDNTPIYNVIFDLKYLIGEVNDYNYSLFYSDAVNDNYVYKLNYDTALMYRVNSDILNWNFNFDNPLLNQNDFLYQGFGIENVLVEHILKSSSNKEVSEGVVYTFKNKFNGYIYVNDNINSILIDGVLYYKDDFNYVIDNYLSLENLNEKRIIYVSDVSEVEVSFVNSNEDYLLYYEVNDKKMEELSNHISGKKLKITHFEENVINAEYEGDAGIIYTSIPYDKGWTVYVDGEKTETLEVGNALLGFNVSDGEHEITLKYSIPYIYISSCISGVSLIGLIILNKRIKKIG